MLVGFGVAAVGIPTEPGVSTALHEPGLGEDGVCGIGVHGARVGVTVRRLGDARAGKAGPRAGAPKTSRSGRSPSKV